MLELNKIYQGDCLEVMKSIDDNSIDMILCDLPYGTTDCYWDVIIPFNNLWKEYNRIIKFNSAIVLTSSQPFTSELIHSNIKNFKYSWIWNKVSGSNFQLAKIHPLKIHEDICVFSYGKVPYYPIMELADLSKNHKQGNAVNGGMCHLASGITKYSKDYDNTKRYPKSIITISRLSKECNSHSRLHPTQKPVALFEYLIKTYTNEGNLVLDNCIGSGTTAIACINTNRNFIGIEKEKKYVDIANMRISELPKQLDSFCEKHL